MKTLDHQPVKLETKSMSDENISDLEEPTQLKQLKLNGISKPLWIKFTRKKFDSLIKDFINNLKTEDYKTTVNNPRYDLKNAETFLLEHLFNKKN